LLTRARTTWAGTAELQLALDVLLAWAPRISIVSGEWAS
jgi:hypothetical protein